MSLKLNDWKVLKIFTVSVIAAIFSASLSKVISVQAQAMSELTIEERLVKVREQLKQKRASIKHESDTLSSTSNSLRAEKDTTLQAQWDNYWNDWCDSSWCDWSDTSDEPESEQESDESDQSNAYIEQ